MITIQSSGVKIVFDHSVQQERLILALGTHFITYFASDFTAKLNIYFANEYVCSM
jgi:hypothetical protein